MFPCGIQWPLCVVPSFGVGGAGCLVWYLFVLWVTMAYLGCGVCFYVLGKCLASRLCLTFCVWCFTVLYRQWLLLVWRLPVLLWRWLLFIRPPGILAYAGVLWLRCILFGWVGDDYLGVVSLFSCLVVWCFAYIMTAVVVVSCFSVFGVCCFVYTMTTVSVVLVFFVCGLRFLGYDDDLCCAASGYFRVVVSYFVR